MKDLLGLMAEVAVGLTGFAAVAAALGRSPSQADVRLDRVRLRGLVEIGIVAIVGALLPQVLWPEEPFPQWVWMVSAGSMLAAGVGVAYAQTRRARELAMDQMMGYSRPGAVVIRLAGYGSLLLLAAGLIMPQVPTDRAYVGALFLFLVMVCNNFLWVASSMLTHRLGHDD